MKSKQEEIIVIRYISQILEDYYFGEVERACCARDRLEEFAKTAGLGDGEPNPFEQGTETFNHLVDCGRPFLDARLAEKTGENGRER